MLGAHTSRSACRLTLDLVYHTSRHAYPKRKPAIAWEIQARKRGRRPRRRGVAKARIGLLYEVSRASFLNIRQNQAKQQKPTWSHFVVLRTMERRRMSLRFFFDRLVYYVLVFCLSHRLEIAEKGRYPTILPTIYQLLFLSSLKRI